MKKWKIPVEWTMTGVVKVKAETLEEAIEIARDADGVIPLPDDKYTMYLDDSWTVNEESDLIEEFNKEGSFDDDDLEDEEFEDDDHIALKYNEEGCVKIDNKKDSKNG